VLVSAFGSVTPTTTSEACKLNSPVAFVFACSCSLPPQRVTRLLYTYFLAMMLQLAPTCVGFRGQPLNCVEIINLEWFCANDLKPKNSHRPKQVHATW
jgi:hypothetical protein